MFSPIRMEGSVGSLAAMTPLAAGTPPAAPKPTATAAPTAKPVPKAPPTPQEIEQLSTEWTQNPAEFSRFQQLEALVAMPGTYTFAWGPASNVTTRTFESTAELISAIFWQKAYAKLTAAQRSAAMRELVRNIGPKVGPLHAEVLITGATKDVREVADAIDEELHKLPQAEIASGKRDAAFLRDLEDALHARRQAELSGATAKGGTTASVTASPSDRRWAIAPAVGASYVGVYAPIGEKLSQGSAALALSLDWMSGNRGTKSQPYFGIYGQVSGGDLFGIGGRTGIAYDWTGRLEQRFGLSAGYLRLRGEETKKDDIPVDVTGVTPDRRAYVARANNGTDRTFQGGMLMANLETDLRVYRASQSPFSLNGFLALSAGLVGGTVSDEGCSYTVPAEDARVKPEGDHYLVSSPKAFGSRCRSGEFSLGGAFGLAIGVRGEL